jgi:hypothetical protein
MGQTGSIQYNYSTTQNNGQITGLTRTLNYPSATSETIGYTYDALKRHCFSCLILKRCALPADGQFPRWNEIRLPGFAGQPGPAPAEQRKPTAPNHAELLRQPPI